jgi:hypothetical protein
VTKLEKEVLDSITKAFNTYIEVEREEMQHPDDVIDFKNGVHVLQRIIATREARRLLPEVFPFKEGQE